LLEEIVVSLKKRNLHIETIVYGKYKQEDYFEKLKVSKAMLYLSHSESQGLALQEAWVRDVPTLVFTRGYFAYGKHHFEATNISAPYLNEKMGLFFTEKNFEETLTTFLTTIDTFTPREYVVENLSDSVCAQHFTQLVTS
jgi:hypothetical protein